MKNQNGFFQSLPAVPSCLAAAFSAALLLQPSAFAANNYWKGGASGDFTNAANWSTLAVPTASDVTYFTNNSAVSVAVNTAVTNSGSGIDSSAGSLDMNIASGAAWVTTNNLQVGQTAGFSPTLSLTNGGLAWVGGSLTVGYNAGMTGAMSLAGGQLVVTNSTSYLGFLGNANGTLTQSGGTASWLTLIIGYGSGSKGTLNVTAGTNLTTGAGAMYVGYLAGATGSILMTGGQLVTTNTAFPFQLGYSGLGNVTVSNGQWLANNVKLGVSAGGVGMLNVAGGSNVFAGSLLVGNVAGTTGAVTLSGGYLSAPTVTIGLGGALNTAAGSLLLSGGAVLETTNLTVQTTTLGGAGTFTNREGGVLQFTTAAPTITTNNGGSMVVSNAVIGYRNVANADIANANVAKMIFQGNNAFRLNNSTNALRTAYTFDANVAPIYQSLQLLGAAPTWQSGVLTVGAGGELLVSNAANATVSALVTNLGSVRVVNSTVTWRSNVVISGRYLSNPSTNIFTTNVMVSASGSLSGSNGDLFVFHRDFINQSTNRSDFNLVNAAVLFTNASSHTLNLTNSTAFDLGGGSSVSQFATNFAIGTLSIALSNQVTLTGVKSGATTNALYVGWLDLTAWTTNAAGLTNTLQAALTLNDISLYYDPNDTRNAYLQDTQFNLWGGGLLIPIPEPSTVGLMLGGALLPAWLLRRKGGRR